RPAGCTERPRPGRSPRSARTRDRHPAYAEVRGIIEDGVAAGEFDVLDVQGTTLAVLSLCIDVARWFSVNGPRTPEEVGALYADLVLRMVGAKQPDRT
ncbi:TetR family transcriptional regulator, partial [Streptomyces spiralis]